MGRIGDNVKGTDTESLILRGGERKIWKGDVQKKIDHRCLSIQGS